MHHAAILTGVEYASVDGSQMAMLTSTVSQSYCPKAAVPRCLQGYTHCTESESNSTETVICYPVICDRVSAWEPQKRPEIPLIQTAPARRGTDNDPSPRNVSCPPNTRHNNPTQNRRTRDHTDDADIDKNPGLDDVHAGESKIHPHHRESITRLASEIETAFTPQCPVKLYKYVIQALSEALKKRHQPPPPPPEDTMHTPHTQSSTTHGAAEIPSSKATPSHTTQYCDTLQPLTSVATDTTIQTQEHNSAAGINMTTAVNVVCPRCHMAEFAFFRCTTCKYFAIHEPDTPDTVPGRLYGVMSPDTL